MNSMLTALKNLFTSVNTIDNTLIINNMEFLFEGDFVYAKIDGRIVDGFIRRSDMELIAQIAWQLGKYSK